MTSDRDTPVDCPENGGVIDRLYEVAVNPMRYEELLDHWEAMIAPQRAATANESGAPALGVDAFTGHFLRADKVLDRFIAESQNDTPQAMIAQIRQTAALAVDKSLRLIAVNAAAAQVFGVTSGAHLRELPLVAGEAAMLTAQADRLINGNAHEPVILRLRMAETDRLMVVHLRFVTPADQPPFVILLSSQVQWPAAFGDMLHTAFDLSPAEIEVVRALTLGQSLSDIADARGRSIDTIRAQLKSVMGKTETRSQSELVRLTLSTMDIAQFSEDAAAQTPETSQGFDTLEPRPFQTMKTADGRRLDYLILGDPAGKPCFFFPLDYGLVRWPASAEAEAARRGIKVIVPVRPGYGQSTPLPKGVPYVVQLADDMRALLDHLGIERLPLVTLGGDSFIAIAFHAAYPERLTGLICCAGVLPLTRAEQYERMDKWHRFILAGARYTPHLLPFMVKAGFALARKLGKRGFVNAVYGKSPADVATFGIDEVYEAIVCGSEVALSEGHSAHDAFSREVIAHETTNWTAEVAALRGSVPVIFLNGSQDPQVPPATLAEYQSDHDWIDFRIYPDAGQLLFFLKWRDVLPLIEEFQEG